MARRNPAPCGRGLSKSTLQRKRLTPHSPPHFDGFVFERKLIVKDPSLVEVATKKLGFVLYIFSPRSLLPRIRPLTHPLPLALRLDHRKLQLLLHPVHPIHPHS